MPRSVVVAAFLASVFLASCAESHGTGDDAGDPARDAGAPSYAGAYISPECAPDDGAALRLTVWEGAVPECSADPARRSLSFYFFEGTDTFFPIVAPETITSRTTSGGFGNGSATACPGGTPPCRVSQDWSLTFESFEDGVGASGSYSITFADGTMESGRFDASWCSFAPPTCG